MKDLFSSAVVFAIRASEKPEKFERGQLLGEHILSFLAEQAEDEQTDVVLLSLYMSLMALTESAITEPEKRHEQ